MKLICAHCHNYDAAPLSSIPRGWVDIVPDPTSLPPVTCMDYKTEAGTIADTFGICPICEEYRKTAFQVPLEPLPEDDGGPMLF